RDQTSRREAELAARHARGDEAAARGGCVAARGDVLAARRISPDSKHRFVNGRLPSDVDAPRPLLAGLH
ncbi:unnamed protein product, partial [Urochloa humidicola]